jgi:hypothetical protein
MNMDDVAALSSVLMPCCLTRIKVFTKRGNCTARLVFAVLLVSLFDLSNIERDIYQNPDPRRYAMPSNQLFHPLVIMHRL